jgi:hypothetical protein
MTTSNLFYRQQKNLQNFGIWDPFSFFSKNKICNFPYWLINITQGPIYFEVSIGGRWIYLNTRPHPVKTYYKF